MMFEFARIRQGQSIGTGTLIPLPSANEEVLRDMGK